ncbi:hypothetical protein V3C99_009817 [Haemonchus contortus]
MPVMQYVEHGTYLLQRNASCRGGKVYEIDDVQDIDQCTEACLKFNCSAVNLLQLGESEYKCEILDILNRMVETTGSACFFEKDVVRGMGYRVGMKLSRGYSRAMGRYWGMRGYSGIKGMKGYFGPLW